MPEQTLIQRVLRMLGLHDHSPRLGGAARAAGHLHQLREQPLGCPPVGGKQPCICAHNTNPGQGRKVVALRQHLGTDQDIDIT